MSKKTNTLLFILGGTVFNILITVLSFLLLLLIYGKFIYQYLSGTSSAWVLPIIFVASIVISFLVYRFAIRVIMKKVDMEKYFDPIFKTRKGARKY